MVEQIIIVENVIFKCAPTLKAGAVVGLGTSVLSVGDIEAVKSPLAVDTNAWGFFTGDVVGATPSLPPRSPHTTLLVLMLTPLCAILSE